MLAWMVTSGVSVILVLLVRRIFRGKISLRLQYALWLPVLVRLLIPINMIDTDMSILNLFPRIQESSEAVAPTAVPEGKTNHRSGTFLQSQGMPVMSNGRIQLVGHQDERPTQSRQEPLLPGPEDNKTKRHPWGQALSGLWIAGMALAGAAVAGVNLHFASRLRRARRALDIGDKDFPARDRRLPVYETPGLPSPCLFGLFRPAVYMPEGITGEQLPYVLAHEISHYRMGDAVWSLLRSLCLVLHWYNPLVWLAVHMSRRDSELACDENTIRRLGEGNRGAYGRVLLDLTAVQGSRVDFLCCATTMMAEGKSLKERVQMIARRPRTMAVTGVSAAVLMLGIFCVACTGSREGGGPGVFHSRQYSSPVEDNAALNPTAGQDDTFDGGESGQEESMNGRESAQGENVDGGGSEQAEITDGGATDSEALDPWSDHVLSDNVYYSVIKDTLVDDPYFTMEVPKSFVGQVAYGVELGKNQDGESYLQNLTLFHLPSVSRIGQGEPWQSWCALVEGGCLGGCLWTGLPDLEPDLEEIAYRSGTWDIREMEYILAADYDMYAGMNGRLIQANQAGTGAYFWTEPTDVQFDPQKPGTYMACLEQLAECQYSFAAKNFPYEKLEGYSGNIPRWRQDFEEAETVYSWFTSMGEAPMKTSAGSAGESRSLEIDSMMYAQVDLPGVNTLQDLREYVNRYFTSEITEALFAGRRPILDDKGRAPFVEKDGALYCLSGGVGQYHRRDAERQYAVYFKDASGEESRTPEMSGQNGKGHIACVYMVCRLNWSIMPGGTLPVSELVYTMEQQEDGSWRMAGEYELPVSLTLEESFIYGAYTAAADRMLYSLTLNRDGTFNFCNMCSSYREPEEEGNLFYWSEDMLVLEFGDSDKVWYLQQQNGRWEMIFREDLSILDQDDPSLGGVVFEKIS